MEKIQSSVRAADTYGTFEGLSLENDRVTLMTLNSKMIVSCSNENYSQLEEWVCGKKVQKT